MIAGAAGVGYSMSVQVERRYSQLKELRRMAALLMGEITYGCSLLPEAFLAVSARVEAPISVFLKNLSEELKTAPGETLGAVFSRHVQEELGGTALEKKDLEMLKRMGSLLGYLDKEMQLRALGLYEKELDQELGDTYGKMPEKKKLYRTLGMMAGLFLAILLL
jgi:stage III sporulation protein AB